MFYCATTVWWHTKTASIRAQYCTVLYFTIQFGHGVTWVMDSAEQVLFLLSTKFVRWTNF